MGTRYRSRQIQVVRPTNWNLLELRLLLECQEKKWEGGLNRLLEPSQRAGHKMDMHTSCMRTVRICMCQLKADDNTWGLSA